MNTYRSVREIGATVHGQHVRKLRTRGRYNGIAKYVQFYFGEDPTEYVLRATEGWDLTAVMINTVLYKPLITGIHVHNQVDQQVLAFLADDGYRVVEFVARPNEKFDGPGNQLAFVLLDTAPARVSA